MFGFRHNISKNNLPRIIFGSRYILVYNFTMHYMSFAKNYSSTIILPRTMFSFRNNSSIYDSVWYKRGISLI